MKLNKGYGYPFKFRLHTALGSFSAISGPALLARFESLFNFNNGFLLFGNTRCLSVAPICIFCTLFE